MAVTLIPPADPNNDLPGLCNSTITLNATQIDYTVNNDIQQKRTGTEEGRSAQLISGVTQMNITGICIPEGGRTAMENAQILECATNNWGTVTSPGTPSEYPQVNWLIGNERMLIQKLTLIEMGSDNNQLINYVLTIYIDTR